MNNKSGYTLIELVISITVGIFVVFLFFYVIKNTVLFVAIKKQETTVLDNVNTIKSKLNDIFVHDRIRFIYSPETISKAHTGIYSVKDNFIEYPKIHLLDVAAIEYEDYVNGSGGTQVNSGIIAFGIVNRKDKQLLDYMSSEDGFFGIKYLKGNENISDYYKTYSGSKIFDDYINTNVNFSHFVYDYVPMGTGSYSTQGGILRINMHFDNDLDGEYKKSGVYDEYYFSGATFIAQKVDIKVVK